VYSGPRGGVAA